MRWSMRGGPRWPSGARRRRRTAVLASALTVALVAGGTGATPQPVGADPGVCEWDGPAGIFRLAAGADRLYLLVDDGAGERLWQTDGSVAGTIRLRGGIDAGGTGLEPAGHIGSRDLLILDDGIHGPALWGSDGGAAGTHLVRDLHPGLAETALAPLGGIGDRLVLLAADDGVHGVELWRTDGTRHGTDLLRDLRRGRKGSEPADGIDLDGRVLFTADDGIHGPELWRSDGRRAGTRLVKDLRPGLGVGSHPRLLTRLDAAVLFVADRDGSQAALWRTDGTPGGTRPLSSLGRGTAGTRPAFLGRLPDGAVVLLVGGPSEGVLWRTDGTAAGTSRIAALPTRGPAEPLAPSVPGRLLFTWEDAEHGAELWGTDGTADGTGLVRDIQPGPGSSAPWGFIDLGGRVMFFAADLPETEDMLGPLLRPWVSDGTSQGTILAAATTESAFDGLDAGTCGAPEPAVAVGATSWFAANDGSRGPELWHTDGTVGGTSMLDLVPGQEGLAPGDLTALGDLLFFTGRGRTELWRTDGTVAGTIRLLDLGAS